ncbi:MAG: D-aminoacyl-tRNA deacylase, partial [Actinomycetota bacterium]
MRAVVQRVSRATVRAGDETVGSIGGGVVVLVGVGVDDEPSDARWLAGKVRALRIFRDENGAMNRSLEDARGDVLAVSQFTLHGDARRGRRPSYIAAASPDKAEPLY